MHMMKILITGARGQLGRDCVSILNEKCAVTAVDIEELDITSAPAVSEAIHSMQPRVIINCAAFTQVDACESQVETAWRVNADGPANLAAAAAKTGARLIHVSTDYVFDGQKPVPQAYIESDATNPLSVYGQSKLAGEERIAASCNDYMIFRTAWLYGANGKNFIRTILGKVLNEPETRLKIVNDQYGSPTWSYELARQIASLLTSSATGIYHASAEGYCTWYDLSLALLQALDLTGRITACTTAEYPTPAVRPQNSILDNHRLKSENRNVMAHWHDGLKEFIKIHGQQLMAELNRI